MTNLQRILIKSFNDLSEVRDLMWFPDKGMGFFPVLNSDMPYDIEYFQRYQKQSDTPIGRALTKARVELVRKYYTGLVLDIGIGSGQFVQGHGKCLGFDVNPAGIEWLQQNGLFWNPYIAVPEECKVFTFWDSLEHILDMEEIISKVPEMVFLSIPIFDSAEHCLRSKHFRKNEHIWYFTSDGIKAWFNEQGFVCLEESDIETQIGREGICTYVFKRS